MFFMSSASSSPNMLEGVASVTTEDKERLHKCFAAFQLINVRKIVSKIVLTILHN